MGMQQLRDRLPRWGTIPGQRRGPAAPSVRGADFPLLAGWEEPGVDDARGWSDAIETPLWPGLAYSPRPGWVADARAVIVTGADALPSRYRRRHALVYASPEDAAEAYAEAVDLVEGLPVRELLSGGFVRTCATTEIQGDGQEELRLLSWMTRDGVAVRGAGAVQLHRRGQGLLVSVDRGDGLGVAAACRSAEVDRADLAPVLDALDRCRS